MSNLQVFKSQSPATVAGVQLVLGSEGKIDEAVIERIKAIAKEVKKLAHNKLLKGETARLSFDLNCDPETLAYCVKYLGFCKPEVWFRRVETHLYFRFEGLAFTGTIKLIAPFEVEVE